MMAHTPGPWKVVEEKQAFLVVREWDDKVRPDTTNTYGSYLGAHIADIDYLSDNATPTREQAEANARLIAAAPDLLEALKEWLDTPFFETKEEWQEWVDDYRPRVEQAIAKAESER